LSIKAVGFITIVKRVKSLGLLKFYEKDDRLKEYIDKLRYVALVPFFSIGQTLALLTDRRREDLATLFRKYPALRALIYDYYIPVGFAVVLACPIGNVFRLGLVQTTDVRCFLPRFGIMAESTRCRTTSIRQTHSQ